MTFHVSSLLAGMSVLGAENYRFDWSVVTRNAPLMLHALVMTFKVSIAAELMALVVGLVAGVGRAQKSALLRLPATVFVEFFRSVPILVLLIWLFYGVSIVLGINFTAFAAGVLGLGLYYGAFLAEVFRAGLQAVPAGQRESALTLGLSRWQTLYAVVLPQAVRIVIPPLANSYVGMIKDATLVSVLGLTELMRSAQTVVAATFRPFEVYTFVALVYLVMIVIFGRLVALLERRLSTKAKA